MEMKLYGSHMEMKENLSDIKNISFNRNVTVWKSYKSKNSEVLPRFRGALK